jgi:hypothetical protein
VRLRLALWPAARVAGRLGALREKYLVEIVAPLMTTDALPEFVAVTVRVLLLPGVTLPKLRLAFPRERLPTAFVEPPPALTPWHPTREPRAKRSSPAASVVPRQRIGVCLDCFCIVRCWKRNRPSREGLAFHQSETYGAIEVDFEGTCRESTNGLVLQLLRISTPSSLVRLINSPTTFLRLLASRAALFRNDQLFSPEVPRGSAPSGVQRT